MYGYIRKYDLLEFLRRLVPDEERAIVSLVLLGTLFCPGKLVFKEVLPHQFTWEHTYLLCRYIVVIGCFFKYIYIYSSLLFGCMFWQRNTHGRLNFELPPSRSAISETKTWSTIDLTDTTPIPLTMNKLENNIALSIKDYLHLTRIATPSCIMFSANTP